MRFGVFISVASHVVLVALALFGTPKLFDTPSIASIEVDLVRPDEIERPPDKPKEEKPAPWNPLPEKSDPPPQAATPQPAEQAAARTEQSAAFE